jgi:hypothetical protein
MSINVSQSDGHDADMFLPGVDVEQSDQVIVVGELKHISASLSSLSIKMDATQNQVAA